MDGPGIDPIAVGLAAGDERAFADLYDRYAQRLYRAAMGILGCREDAEDAIQELFLGILRSQHTLAGVQDLTAYLFTALHRAAIRCAVRRRKTPLASSDACDSATVSDFPAEAASPHSERLQRALAALPMEQREVIAMKIDGELTFAQIAQVLGVSTNTVASRYRYALE
jgi:RNA polymerase sigma-70 factor (ECF subfamily)